MPATAAHQAPDGEPGLASVVELSTRRGVKAPTIESAMENTTDAELQAQAEQHWTRVFTAAGLDLGAPETVAVIKLFGKEMERLVGGLLVIREGRDDLPANPTAGVDFTSAVEFTSVLRDLVRAAEARAERD